MKRLGLSFVAAAVGCAFTVAGCEAEEAKAPESNAPAATAPAQPAPEAKAPEAAPAAEVKVAEATPPAAAPQEEAKAPEAAPAAPEAAAPETKVAEATPAAAPAADGAKGGGTKDAEGKYRLPDGTLTYNVAADGTVDWYTYSGYKRFHSECHVCHGPGAEGSTFAPSLKDSLKTMNYQDFVTVVMSGRVRKVAGGTDFVMPALGDNKNVACFIDDLYAYIKARADDAVPFGRPEKREDKPEAAKEYEKACFGE